MWPFELSHEPKCLLIDLLDINIFLKFLELGSGLSDKVLVLHSAEVGSADTGLIEVPESLVISIVHEGNNVI